MTEFGTDDPSNDYSGVPTDLTEFMKTLRAPQGKDPSKPLLVYTPEDPYAFLKRIPKTTAQHTPYRERGEDRELINLFEERRQRERGITPEVDLKAIEAFHKSELIDLYTQRKLEERTHRSL